MSKNIKISGKILSRYKEIISDEYLEFIQQIHEKFDDTRINLLNERKKRQKKIDDGGKLDFLSETKKIRESDWKIKNIPQDLLKRQGEITGPPVPKKMLISALNSGADCYMTDFEDSLTPTFENLIQGQLNVKDAISRKIDFTDPQSKKEYKLKNSQICLSGFSQGCMMSINVGLTSNESFNCIVGFSGKILNKKDLSSRIKSKTNILMIHGDSDTIVSPNNLLEAKDFLIRHKINIETLMIKNCDHHIPIEASSAALNFIKKNFNNE